MSRSDHFQERKPKVQQLQLEREKAQAEIDLKREQIQVDGELEQGKLAQAQESDRARLAQSDPAASAQRMADERELHQIKLEQARMGHESVIVTNSQGRR